MELFKLALPSAMPRLLHVSVDREITLAPTAVEMPSLWRHEPPYGRIRHTLSPIKMGGSSGPDASRH